MRFTPRRWTPLLAAALVAAAAGASDARIWPAWTIAGSRTLQLSPGYADLSGSYSFALPGNEGSASSFALGYDVNGVLSASGQFASGGGDLTIFNLAGQYSVDSASGVQHVRLVEFVKNPKASFLAKSPAFSFDGDVAADALSVVGTFQRKAGYLGLTGDESGPMTLRRSGAAGGTSFSLSIATRMDDHGRIFGVPTTVGNKTVASTASVTLYGTHFVVDHVAANAVSGGKITGVVKTRTDGTSTGLLTIVGPKWKARLAGPVDAAGFHATCGFSGGGFVVTKLPLTLDVTPGPTPAVPPPSTKPPPNQITTATATVVNGAVTVTVDAVPKKFFGAVAGLTIQFPQSDFFTTVNGHAIVHADPSDASAPAPNARRCIVTVGGATYATANAPADVTIDIDKLDASQGGQIELLATGTVVTVDGKKKTVDVLIEAVVQ